MAKFLSMISRPQELESDLKTINVQLSELGQLSKGIAKQMDSATVAHLAAQEAMLMQKLSVLQQVRWTLFCLTQYHSLCICSVSKAFVGIERHLHLLVLQLLNRHLQNTSSGLSKQSKFDESCAALETFLDAVQETLRTEDPLASADEAAIRRRLDELRDVCRQFRLEQQDLDSLNDLGYKLPLSPSDADRLHTINNR